MPSEAEFICHIPTSFKSVITIIGFLVTHLITNAICCIYLIDNGYADNIVSHLRDQKATPIALTLTKFLIQLIASVIALIWFYSLIRDTAMHSNMRMLQLSMCYVCFVCPFTGVLLDLYILTTNTISDHAMFSIICAHAISENQIFLHGIVFLVERWVATKYRKTYEHSSMQIVVFMFLVFLWLTSTLHRVLSIVAVITYIIDAFIMGLIGLVLVFCAVMLFRFNQMELRKPIQSLSEKYIIYKNVCKTQAVFVCILIQLFTHVTITVVTNTIALTKPSQTFINVCLLCVFSASGTACALISINFMLWKWKLKRTGAIQTGLKMFRGVTGSIVPMTVESQLYFQQFQNAWR